MDTDHGNGGFSHGLHGWTRITATTFSPQRTPFAALEGRLWTRRKDEAPTFHRRISDRMIAASPPRSILPFMGRSSTTLPSCRLLPPMSSHLAKSLRLFWPVLPARNGEMGQTASVSCSRSLDSPSASLPLMGSPRQVDLYPRLVVRGERGIGPKKCNRLSRMSRTIGPAILKHGMFSSPNSPVSPLDAAGIEILAVTSLQSTGGSNDERRQPHEFHRQRAGY
jgi:hypothetical protein